jgi:fatty-acyl-CoA synthase
MTEHIATTLSKAREHSIGDLLRRSARRKPNKIALICGNVRWTFAELDAICNRLALQLLFLWASESMGNHDSNVMDAGRVC